MHLATTMYCYTLTSNQKMRHFISFRVCFCFSRRLGIRVKRLQHTIRFQQGRVWNFSSSILWFQDDTGGFKWGYLGNPQKLTDSSGGGRLISTSWNPSEKGGFDSCSTKFEGVLTLTNLSIFRQKKFRTYGVDRSDEKILLIWLNLNAFISPSQLLNFLRQIDHFIRRNLHFVRVMKARNIRS